MYIIVHLINISLSLKYITKWSISKNQNYRPFWFVVLVAIELLQVLEVYKSISRIADWNILRKRSHISSR